MGIHRLFYLKKGSRVVANEYSILQDEWLCTSIKNYICTIVSQYKILVGHAALYFIIMLSTMTWKCGLTVRVIGMDDLCVHVLICNSV